VTTLIINPSSIISTYCYSIFRIEVDSSCENSCIYCYANWYRIENINITKRHIEEFRKFIQHISQRFNKIPIFRMSTLVEPFQEKSILRTLHILKLCIKYEVPLIINTKNIHMLRNEDILNQILKLHDRRLVLIQLSICTINEELSRKLEPKAPNPELRLEMLDILKSYGIPTVVRYQPLIPGVCEYEYVDFIKICYQKSIRHIILEPIRLTRQVLINLSKIVKDLHNVRWIPYSEITKNILKPCNEWFRDILNKILEECDRYGISVATCKDPHINILKNAEDCCGIYLMNSDRILKKATIYDLKRYNIICNDIYELLHKLEELSDKYIAISFIQKLPKEYRKKLKHHYKVLLNCYRSKNLNVIIC